MGKLQRSKFHWQDRRRYRPWLSPAHPILYFLASAFMLIAAFIPPTTGSPFHHTITGFQWYIIPAIGISAPLWGVVYYWGLLIYEWKIGKQLDVTRQAYWAQDPDCPGEYVQRAEIIDHTWLITARGDNMSDGFAEPTAALDEELARRGGDNFGMRERREPAAGKYDNDDDTIFGGATGGRNP